MNRGFTVTEILVVMAITMVLLTISLPVFTAQIHQRQLASTLQAVAVLLDEAQALAVISGQDQFVTIGLGPQWCLALTANICDCQKKDDCSYAPGYTAVSSAQFPSSSLVTSTFNPSHYTRFDGRFGLSSGFAGSMIFERANVRGKVILSNLARVRLCIIDTHFAGIEQCD